MERYSAPYRGEEKRRESVPFEELPLEIQIKVLTRCFNDVRKMAIAIAQFMAGEIPETPKLETRECRFLYDELLAPYFGLKPSSDTSVDLGGLDEKFRKGIRGFEGAGGQNLFSRCTELYLAGDLPPGPAYESFRELERLLKT
ncbi:hypothetical protein ACFLZN_02065 [Nanoarchaeota archaeon]